MRVSLIAWIAPALMGLGLVAPAGATGWTGAALVCGLGAIAASVATIRAWPAATHAALATIALVLAALAPLLLVGEGGSFGAAASGLWLCGAGVTLLVWTRLTIMANRPGTGLTRWIAPALFGVTVLWLWQVLAVGFAVPQVLLPTPQQVGRILATRLDMLWPDFRQTFFKSVLPGYAIGCGAGLAVAVIADRFGFLGRGLLPVCRLASAMPIVGIAPIMVMWFGFDWQSKAAVVAVVTFFPMLVNALAGLAAADEMLRDLMHSYAASPAQTLRKLRLPTALPFVFNALRINSTLALISAIVAEFFGSPILGLGFRISAEVARLNVDVVWAAIAIAALAGSLFYALIAVVERALTFWHPSYRT